MSKIDDTELPNNETAAAKQEGREEIIKLAFLYPNDQELGNIIRRMSWKLK